MTTVKNPRIEAALEKAIAGGGTADLFEQLGRGSGLPGVRPNMELARAVGLELAARGRRADPVLKALASAEDEYPKVVAAAVLAARRAAKYDAKGSMEDLQGIVEEGTHHVRAGVVFALRWLLESVGDEIVTDLAAWTDGYLQAHVALEAMADRTLLARLKDKEGILARLDEAFELADASPRSAERSQGMRLLRQGMPGQIAIFAGRFPEVLSWLEKKAEAKRPETREVVANAIAKLRKGSLSDAGAAELSAALEKSAKPPRDPSRIVHGTRKRAKGRR
ncbi:MAG: hypothetical protein L6Q76_27445 [Polyangiaceae bacterium]|nr:hypothetical protein [Polyangiaceae bacterium]